MSDTEKKNYKQYTSETVDALYRVSAKERKNLVEKVSDILKKRDDGLEEFKGKIVIDDEDSRNAMKAIKRPRKVTVPGSYAKPADTPLISREEVEAKEKFSLDEAMRIYREIILKPLEKKPRKSSKGYKLHDAVSLAKLEIYEPVIVKIHEVVSKLAEIDEIVKEIEDYAGKQP
jgi:hypothetical protein